MISHAGLGTCTNAKGNRTSGQAQRITQSVPGVSTLDTENFASGTMYAGTTERTNVLSGMRTSQEMGQPSGVRKSPIADGSVHLETLIESPRLHGGGKMGGHIIQDHKTPVTAHKPIIRRVCGKKNSVSKFMELLGSGEFPPWMQHSVQLDRSTGKLTSRFKRTQRFKLHKLSDARSSSILPSPCVNLHDKYTYLYTFKKQSKSTETESAGKAIQRTTNQVAILCRMYANCSIMLDCKHLHWSFSILVRHNTVYYALQHCINQMTTYICSVEYRANILYYTIRNKSVSNDCSMNYVFLVQLKIYSYTAILLQILHQFRLLTFVW